MSRRAKHLPAFMSKQVTEARRFYLTEGPGNSRLPFVIGAGWERSAPDYRIRRSGLRYAAGEFVAGGQGTLRIGGAVHPLSRGVVFAYGPGVPHEITTSARDRLSKYFVDFAGAGAAAALQAAGILPGVCYAIAAVDEVRAAFEHLLAVGQRGTPTAAKIAALQGQILLLLIADVRLPTGAGTDRSRQTFLRCRDYLEKNFAAIRTAAEAAVACRVTPAYFSRIFRRDTGQPAYRFLMRLKMNQAAALLEGRRFNVGETAEVFGMDPFHFSRVFKRVHGRAPSTFVTADDGHEKLS